MAKNYTGKHPGGRPTIYSAELAERICERLMLGESVNSICRDEDMPNKVTICRWLAAGINKKSVDLIEFCNRYEEARTIQAEMMADEIIDIADDGTNDYVERATKNGDVIVVCDHEHVNRSKLRIESRKWTAEKLLPKKYGAFQKIDHGLSDDLFGDLDSMTPEEIRERKIEVLKRLK